MSEAIITPRTRLLVVDDYPPSLIALGAILASCDAEIVTASSGGEAVKLASTQRFAMIFMDVRLGDMNGLQAANSVRSYVINRHTPVVFTTGATIAQADLDAVRGGNFAVMLKPLSAQEVLSAVGALVGAGICAAGRSDTARGAR